MERQKNDDQAVSPVIAIILMVAITVVLAGVLYVWVISFSGGPPSGPTMTGTFDKGPGPTADRNWTFSVAATSGGDISINKLKLTLESDGITQVEADFAATPATAVGNAKIYKYTVAGEGNISIVDNDNNQKINTGDRFIIDPNPGAEWDTGWSLVFRYSGAVFLNRELV